MKGSNNVAIGRKAGSKKIAASNTVAIGTGARATAQKAIAIGQGSLANVANTVSIGNKNIKRRIMNVAAGVAASDAVNVAQLNAAMAAMAAGSAAAVPVAPTPPAVSAVAVGPNARISAEGLQRRLSELEALVRQQQQRIAQLERRAAAAARAE